MNRLQHEISPYLLQHAHNPVDWYAWRPEAFERARAEQKPILVSIGYATCHWCHVMERESFENPEVAALMNAHFINIKVDREERPDVDAIYMDACQMLTGGGGWPLNCFLTPEGKPFYAGTYYPPVPAHNRPSWTELLSRMAEIWKNERQLALDQAERLTTGLQKGEKALLRSLDAGLDKLPELLNPAKVFMSLSERFDREAGGFGGAPKFPGAMSIKFLLAFHAYSGNQDALEHALFSLDKMIQGGIYDQLGGGFARYATDRAWLIPHFEKMLYDNALLIVALSDAHKLLYNKVWVSAHAPDLAGPEPTALMERLQRYRDTIAETLEFVEREMTHAGGGFFSALDADSEGEEGKFYVWAKSEIDALLGADAVVFNDFYDVSENGNWEHHNILWRAESYEAFAAKHGMPAAEFRKRMADCRKILFEARAQRIRPITDEKVLLGWNALMVSAYASAYEALAIPGYKEAALRNIHFLLEAFRNPASGSANNLLHTWKDGKAEYPAFLEDYAYLIAALLDVWEITFDRQYVDRAAALMEEVLQYFQDAETGLFFFTRIGQEDILLRKVELYDNATPSSNSTMVLNLQRLGILLDRRDWRDLAGRMLEAIQETVERFPQAFARWALGLLQAYFPPREIALVGMEAIQKSQALKRHFIPNGIWAAAEKETDGLALLEGKLPGESSVLYYLCRDFACLRPVETEVEFLKMLADPK
ncbi:MAG: thioredoxin domain-containing protein [Chitinophagales bacterium]|nr:thioredoxin domain-containing protein [Chitinophagales bacterium]